MGIADIENKELRELAEECRIHNWTVEFRSDILFLESNATNPDYPIKKASIVRAGDQWDVSINEGEDSGKVDLGELNYFDLF